MRDIKQTLYRFSDALNQKKTVTLTRTGFWWEEGNFIAWIRKLFKIDVWPKVDLIRNFIYCIDRLENIPIRFASRPGVVLTQAFDFHGYLIAAQAVKNSVIGFKHPEIQKQLARLRRRMIAMLYRLEEENSGLHKGANDIELVRKLQAVAAKWKRSQKIFWHSLLSDFDMTLLEHACRYPDFVNLLFEDEDLMNDFFLWTLRDGLDVAPYIEFPANQEIITRNNLRGRIGRLGGDLLKIQKMPADEGLQYKEKVLTLPFEGREISILDENRKIVFRGNYILTIKEVFKIFQNKHADVGNVEFFSQGITNWNANYLGWWNADKKIYVVIDIEDSEWWKSLPTMEMLTTEEAQKRYGTHLTGYNWNLSAKASREYINLHFDKTHAFLEMAIPDGTGQRYTIYDFGKFAIKLPSNQWEKFKMFCVTVPAAIVYPDENIFFSNRQHVGYAFELTPEQGKSYMDSVRGDIMQARAGNLFFQIETENCGKWIQLKLEEQLGKEKVPNLYRIPLLKSEPLGFLLKVFGFVSYMPLYIQTFILKWAHFPFGAWKGQWMVERNGQKVWKSLLHSTFLQDTVVYLPAYLHKQQEQGVFASEPNRHRVLVKRFFNNKSKNDPNLQDPFSTLNLFEDTGT